MDCALSGIAVRAAGEGAWTLAVGGVELLVAVPRFPPQAVAILATRSTMITAVIRILTALLVEADP